MSQELTTTKPEQKVSVFQKTADQIQTYAKKIVPDDRAGEFWTQISIMAKQSPAIRNARPDSFITAMLACVTLDLMPNTPEGLAYIIPYKDSVQFQIGYKGLMRLAYRSGEVVRINTEVVYDGDEFEYELGLEPKLRHIPNREVKRTDTSLITHAYAVIKLKNGETFFEVMDRSELDKIKEFAKASTTDAPWNKWFAEQCKKTVLKRAFKLIPSSTTDNRMALAAAYDSWSESGRIKHDGGTLVEQEPLTPEELAEIRRKRMEAAAAERKQMVESGFTAQVVQPFHEGDESQGEPQGDEVQVSAEESNTPIPSDTYAEVSYQEVKRQVNSAAGEVTSYRCEWEDCQNSQTPELAEKSREKFGITLCRLHWGMAKKGEIDPNAISPDEVMAGMSAQSEEASE